MIKHLILAVYKANPALFSLEGTYNLNNNLHKKTYLLKVDQMKNAFKAGVLLHWCDLIVEVDIENKMSFSHFLGSYFQDPPEILELNVAAKGKPANKPLYKANIELPPDFFTTLEPPHDAN
jgi:hypothetical protein